MKLSKSLAIVKQINISDFDDETKGAAILNVLRMRSLGAVSKHDLIAALGWCLELAFEMPEEDGTGASDQAVRLVRKGPCPYNPALDCSEYRCVYCNWRKRYEKDHQVVSP